MPDPIFLALCAQVGLPCPDAEFRFDPKRRWRFDYAWQVNVQTKTPGFAIAKVALEVEGGIHTGGRHTRGRGFEKDMEKYNAAALAGWVVVRCTPSTLRTLKTVEMIKALIALKKI